MPADVHDIQRDMVVIKRKEIQEVTRKFIAGNVTPGNLQILHLDIAGWQQGMLNACRRFQVPGHSSIILFELLI